jgi:hypothetical protein
VKIRYFESRVNMSVVMIHVLLPSILLVLYELKTKRA